MSKTSIPTIKLLDDECNILFQSITEKLKIENPKFFYPIYKKIVDDESMSPDELRCTMLDSKFKCKQILAKLVDSDDEEQYDSDESEAVQLLEKAVPKSEEEAGFQKSRAQTKTEAVQLLEAGFQKSRAQTKTEEEADYIGKINPSSELLIGGSEIDSIKNESESENDETDIKDVDDLLCTTLDKDVLKSSDNDEDDEDNEDNDNYEDNDEEINEAINNTYFATAIIERTNKSTGEKICNEEKIHIKKSALLEPLKIMKDEYVLPSKIQNKNISDESLKNTMNKLNSYNNSGHVESLFLYLGNKLVESGKCPSFPYYYGCINGDDPNYHHNITDEYESVSRTKWFRDRVKTDFDLLIIENDDLDDYENEMINDANKTAEDLEKGIENPARRNKEDGTDDCNGSDGSDGSDCSHSSDGNDSDSNGSDSNGSDSEEEKEKNESSETFEAIIIEPSLEFIKDMDTEDLNFDIIECTDNNESSTEESSILLQDGGSIVECKTNCIGKCTSECDNCDNCNNCNESNSDCDDFIEELSDVDKDNLSIGDFDNNSNNMYYIKCESMPVSLSLMEKLDCTLDDILDEEYNMKETEWFSIFFQVAFGLAVAQKYFNFVHNDLHSSNVMFKKSEIKFLYFQIESNYYKIPTYGKITKIIDFARGTFKFGDRWVFSDQFKEDNDAYGQYDYPVDGTLKNCEHKPNPSFDLVRLGTTVIQRLDELPTVREFVEQITLDDNDTSLCYDEDTFQLYIDIAHNCHNAVPIEVMKRPEFERFKINKNKLPKGQYVFKY